MESDLARAQVLLERRTPLGVRQAARHEALAAVLLERGEGRRAAGLLASRSRFPLIPRERVAERLLGAGRDRELLQFAAARGDAAHLAIYRAAALLNLGRLEEAEEAAGQVLAGTADPIRLQRVRSVIRERRSGAYDFLMARDGTPLARYSAAADDLVALDESAAVWIDRAGGPHTVEAQLDRIGKGSSFVTTIHPTVQRAAIASLLEYRGSLVALDVRSGEVLAIAATSTANTAFDTRYQPGAVVQPLTLAGAIDRRLRPEKLFPLQCDGFLLLGGHHLLDWGRHDTVAGIEEAMAVSCDVAFARLGLSLGAAAIEEMLARFGFGSVVDTGLITVPLGRIEGGLHDELATGSAAVGQERLVVSALHLAVLAATIANRGETIDPTLILRRETALGEIRSAPRPDRRRAASEEAIRQVTSAMKAAVTHQRGTGRMAAVEGLPMAVKSGISGSAARGYDNTVIAFAPADAPRIAVGIVAEDAGPDPFTGAGIAQDFFEAVAGELGL
jgi:penicillin-binding protein A